ncbi:hypothetical protein LTR35_012641 [Friedmanniomyces endolithicus]|uniref:Heterokaryon incompatibility domain-containing protein n=1 Tax=Friedmanniomyces endolithicus TaxID=329885 RepID=A0AAN6JEN8_9PEZI|nr:hypothetical protein LTR35_012641 [Friedmanniomyces endolithicus]KAK0283835.1 hypothetical protein LTS00_011497 [Friedmanniomyces endolithicus]KAK0327407.1 hypothetical protein LTR82_000921 [Friedmanniomyces endolithicus]KAK0990435.1 hypothetical protein LTR54_012189 [Friedmanniomyces endolithicus]
MEAMIGDVQNRRNMDKSGYQKVEGFAQYVMANFKDMEWLWIDTCCINQDSSQEVNEAVNSMFSWYANAYVCLAYLTDVPDSKDEHEFEASEWFRRGWTLQELLAPQIVVFLSRDWAVIGHKASRGWTSSSVGVEVDAGPSLVPAIASITRVPVSVLHDFEQSKRYTVEERLAWSAGRETTKREDVYYSLLGMFGVRMSLDYGEGTEEARRRLLRKIAKSDQQPDPPMWTATVRAQASHPSVGVEARPVGRLFAALWVDCGSEVAVRADLRRISRLYDWTFGDDDILDGVKDRLASSTTPILLILDNYDDSTVDYNRYVPNGDQVTVVLTTRLSNARRYASADPQDIGKKLFLRLDGLEPDAAVDLLMELSETQDRDHDSIEDAGRIVKALDFHPLAITVAGSLIQSAVYSLQEYANALDSRLAQAELLDTESEQARYKKVSATFEVSAEALARLGSTDPSAHDALALLDILAFMHHQDVHEEIFVRAWSYEESVLSWWEGKDEEANLDIDKLTPWLVAQCRKFLQPRPLEGRMHAFRKARAHLDRLSLVNVDPATKSISLHLLVYEWARARLQRPGFVLCERLVERTEDCCGEISAEVGLVDAQYMLGLVYLENGQVKEAVEQLEHVVQIRESLAEDDSDRLHSQQALAQAYQLNEQIAQATELLEHVVRVREKSLAVDHPDLVGSQHVLASAYLNADNGHNAQAMELLEHAVRVEEKSLAVDHPNRLASQHELASAYLACGQTKQAMELLGHVVKVREKSLLEDHPDRLVSQHELARAYLEDGQTKQAIELLGHVVKVREKSLPEDHPGRLASQHELARAYLEDGQLGLAIELLEHVVRVREKSLPEDHSDQLVSQQVLADVYWEDGQGQRALDLIQHVVAVWQTRKSERQIDHPEQIRSESFLAYMLKELAVSDEALDPVDPSSADHGAEEQA